MLLGMVCSIATAFTQTPMTTAVNRSITKLEYFFDTDPGIGKGTIIYASPADTLHFSTTIPVNNLTGFHTLIMRACDTTGIWSFSEAKGFYLFTTTNNTTNITGAEYFFDSDPGTGKGTPTPIGTSGAVVNFIATIPASLSTGFHFLAIRTKDADGNWGLAETRTFYLSPAAVDLPPITAAEYFYDTDPGVGKAMPLTISTQGDTVTQNFMVPVPSDLSTGDHLLAIRVKNQNGNWSLFEKDTLTVGSIASSVTCRADTTITAPAGQCNTVVNNIDPAISPQDTYTYTLTGATTGNGNGSASGLTFNAGTTTVTYALTNSPNTSCSFKVIVNTNITPSVTVSSSATTICAGTSVTFTATPINGGTPTYQWKLNGANVGSNSNTYQNSTLKNGDNVSVLMTSSLGCASPQSATSTSITMTVLQTSAAAVNIAASSTTICSGTLVIFTASPTNGGDPSYQWQLNGTNIPGATGSTFQSSSLANGDKIKVIMTSSLACASPSSAASNEITMAVNTGAPASVIIAASQTTFCSGQQVTFTATPTSGGSNPVYEWTVNNNAVNTISSTTYQSTTLHDGDVVRVTMSPSQGCGNNTPVYSNSITMHVNPTVAPSVTVTASAIDICSGQQVMFTANPVNGGTPSYQWKLNGINVGGDSAVFRTSTLANADTVKVVMTSSLGCASPQTVVSNSISMDVSPSVTPSVTITASSTTICAGTQVTFTATPTNGGNPHYEWVVNGNEVGTNSSTYQSATLVNGDSVAVYMTSSLPCANPKSPKSNTIVMTVNSGQTYYRDADGDGYGNASISQTSCTQPNGYVLNNTDCDDNNASVNPGHAEICGNGIDDNCNGTIDENCTTSKLPAIAMRTYPVKEGDAGETLLNAVVTLDTIATTNASVHYATADEDAKAGLDYVAASGWLTIPAGSSSGTIQLRIIGDLLREGNEKFIIRFSQPSNLIFKGDSVSEVMIIDDDHNVKKENQTLIIPSVTRRNQIWTIPDIANFENEVLIMDAQGQRANKFVNYRNQTSISNLTPGLYFYKIHVKYKDGESRDFTGRLLVVD